VRFLREFLRTHINLNTEQIMASKKQSDVSSEGNFAHDPQRASEAGKKGGQHPHSGSQHQAEDSKLGGAQRGSSNVANGPDKASQAGRKGGERSHSGK
jgi:hypothetical protein